MSRTVDDSFTSTDLFTSIIFSSASQIDSPYNTLYFFFTKLYPPITYYRTGLLILDRSYLIGDLTNSKIAKTKALEPIKSWHFCISNFWIFQVPNEIWAVQY